jgi:hypothetical protein
MGGETRRLGAVLDDLAMRGLSKEFLIVDERDRLALASLWG